MKHLFYLIMLCCIILLPKCKSVKTTTEQQKEQQAEEVKEVKNTEVNEQQPVKNNSSKIVTAEASPSEAKNNKTALKSDYQSELPPEVLKAATKGLTYEGNGFYKDSMGNSYYFTTFDSVPPIILEVFPEVFLYKICSITTNRPDVTTVAYLNGSVVYLVTNFNDLLSIYNRHDIAMETKILFLVTMREGFDVEVELNNITLITEREADVNVSNDTQKYKASFQINGQTQDFSVIVEDGKIVWVYKIENEIEEYYLYCPYISY